MKCVQRHAAQDPGVTADEAQRVTHPLLLHGQVRGDVSHGPAVAQRGVVPLFGREAFEQRGGPGSLVVDPVPQGVRFDGRQSCHRSSFR